MGVRTSSAFAGTAIANVPASGAETVVSTTNPMSLTVDNAQVSIWAYCNVTAGTTVTALIIGIRRGTTVADTLIGTRDTISTTAGLLYSIVYNVVNITSGLSTNFQWSLTLQATGATGISTVNNANIMAVVF